MLKQVLIFLHSETKAIAQTFLGWLVVSPSLIAYHTSCLSHSNDFSTNFFSDIQS